MAIHIVRSGDTLWSISQKYGVSIQSIVDVNGLVATNNIVIGLALYIPTDDIQIRYYQIKLGDTLSKIASLFQTSISDILSANLGMDPNRLFIGQKIIIPTPKRMALQTLGFLVPYFPQKSLQSLRQLADKLSFVAIVSYSFTAQGWAYAQLEDSEIVVESKRLGIKPLLMIRNFTNEGFSAELAGQVLENPTYRQNLISSITNQANQRGYEGVSIDFEFIPPQRRIDFNTFLRDLKSALGNLILHVNVHAKKEDIPTNRIIGAYDYKAIGEVADIIGVMTIDYGYPTGPPNPVAPIWWVEEVIQYSLQLIQPSKLQISLPLYGYDWRTLDNLTQALSNLNAQNLAILNKVMIHYDSHAAVPWFKYWKGTEEHVVWFSDIRSIVEKYRLIDYYQLLGTTYWHIGLEFPQNWAYVEQNMIVL
jgi:spore germination protein